MRSPRTWASPGQGLAAPLLPLLLLALLLLDCRAADPVFQPDWGFASYEITIPKRLSLQAGPRGHTKQVSYLLHIQGKRHVLRLRPKRLLLPRNLQVFSFTPQGKLVEDHPFIPRDCSYAGTVEGARDSDATVTTCMGGLRGVLAIDARRYQIEPRKGSSTFEHVLYLLKSEALPPGQTCAMTDDGLGSPATPKDSQARVGDMLETYKHTKYLELVLVFDHDRYVYSQSNLTQVVSDGIIMAEIMDTYFQDVHMRIHLSALEVWTDEDKINFRVPAVSQTMKQFAEYRELSINPRVTNDWAHLYFTKRSVSSITDISGKVCSLQDSGSLSTFRDKNLHVPATFATHLLGHVVGMQHDTDYCVCRGQNTCIMGTGVTGFSNCSYGEFWAYTSVDAHCLNNIPETGFVFKRCGNKIVEEGEECDCGTGEECKKDRCCQPNCKLRLGANCSTGLCCHNCHIRPSGYICRKEENECDLAEYCNGQSALCPDDLYKRDGTPCKYEASCFKKGCRSRYMQCQNIFGPDAREAPYQCYEAVNTIGDQYGHCRIKGMNAYEKCSQQNSLCGRIQCINVKTIPDLPDHSTVISTHLEKENLNCWGIGYHLSMVPMGIPDVGVISDGTSCGKNQICINRTCVERWTALKTECSPEECNRRGFCNNKQHCHCMYGWAPPFCEQAGLGGSIDSGPPRALKKRESSFLHIVALLLLRLILFAASVMIVCYVQAIQKLFKPIKKERPPVISKEDKAMQRTRKPKM
ncbi:disintegrin and metalloproteinase domain-containing protein 30-like [Talpa occidentalis]|uniref:disintegrin and metalloproteinase domain-containing protein 30-like n=1 Tax=Talpa occidentalis TaxID=50954 RepID=UPI00188FCEA3|nr:disintegrin and metalloproteinase domain-containing protein 30-like [Talpa occidentalis]